MKLHVILDPRGNVVATMPITGTVIDGTMFGGASPNADNPPVGRNDIAVRTKVAISGRERPRTTPGSMAIQPPKFTQISSAPQDKAYRLYEVVQTDELASHVVRGDLDAFHHAIGQAIAVQRLEPISSSAT